ncbi:MAG: hypothetical protein ACPG4T_17725 [Nannocystaceae bacterium]
MVWIDKAAGFTLVCCVALLATQSRAEPAQDTTPEPKAEAKADKPKAEAKADKKEPATGKSEAEPSSEKPTADTGSGTLRKSMEKGVSEINAVLTKARKKGDASRIACVLDKRQRAERVMEVATGELIVLEGESEAQERSFAQQKLTAASGKLEELVVQARQCAGEDGPQSLNATENQLEREDLVPHNDPTAVPAGNPGVPPPLDPGRPIVSSAVR